jgi:hypothetical protein
MGNAPSPFPVQGLPDFHRCRSGAPPVNDNERKLWLMVASNDCPLLSTIGSGAMPGPRLPVRKIRDVLRLSAAGMSKRQIAVSLGVSATAARDCILRARRAGLGWPLPEGLTDETLEDRLYPPAMVASKERRPRPDWATVHRELRRPGGCNMQSLCKTRTRERYALSTLTDAIAPAAWRPGSSSK